MVNNLVYFIVNVLSVICSFLFAPITLFLESLFPSIVVYINYVNDFIEPVYEYITFMLDFLCITSPMMQMLFGFFVVKYTVYLSFLVIRFLVTVWDKLKP